MGKHAFIIGWDAISCLGESLEQQMHAARSGISGTSVLSDKVYADDFPVTVAGQVPSLSCNDLPYLTAKEQTQWYSPVFSYSQAVVTRALARSQVEITKSFADRVAVSFGTGLGGLDAVLASDREMVASGKLPYPFSNPNACSNMPTGKISMLTGAQGPIVNPVAACATGSMSLIMGAMWIELGLADVVICGAVDFPLVPVILAGFATMNGAYKSQQKVSLEEAQAASRPFSVHRKGFVVSEGAACMILASDEFVQAHGLQATIRLRGYHHNADAHHFVAPHQETVALCMDEALRHADLQAADIAVINAHATSTKVGDQVEAQAIDSVFHATKPAVTASKSLLGHAMGAASAIEIVFAMESMKQNIILPTINYDVDPSLPDMHIVSCQQSLEHEFVLKNAFGFGGFNTSIVLQKV